MGREPGGRVSGPTAMEPSDAFFWHVESATPEIRPLVAGLFLFDRRPNARHVRAALRRLIALAPRLRQRVVEPPLGLGLPVWAADDDFDLDYHLRIVELPGATEAVLLRYASEIFSAPLDHMRPLWEAHVVEHLAGGRAALFLKLHHAVLDGAGSVALFDGLTQARRRDPIRMPEAAKLGVPVAPPAAVRLARDAATMVGALIDPGAAVDGLRRLARGAGGLLAELRASNGTHAWHGDASGIGRRLAVASVDMARLRRLKAALGATINDVVLTAVAGALTTYERGTRGVPEALQCMVPMSLRTTEERASLGNRVGGFTVALPLRLRGIGPRLAAIAAQTTRAKSDGHGFAYHALMQAAAYVPPLLFRAAAQRTEGKVHLICTNVPGPPVRRYFAGARIEAVHPFAPVMRGTPLSIALMSYGGTLGIGVDSDPAAIPDPARVARLLEREFTAIERYARQRKA